MAATLKPNMLGRGRKFLWGIVAVVAALSFWLGGYAVFVNSAEWADARKSLQSSAELEAAVGSVQEIATNPLFFSYRFSGDWAEARMRVRVHGARSQKNFSVHLEKTERGWVVVSVTPR